MYLFIREQNHTLFISQNSGEHYLDKRESVKYITLIEFLLHFVRTLNKNDKNVIHKRIHALGIKKDK